MKRFFVTFLMMFLLIGLGATDAQTSNFNTYSSDGTFTLHWEFSIDSTRTTSSGAFDSVLISPSFAFPEYDGVDFDTYPIVFKKKLVSTNGTPTVDVFLQGAWGSDTLSIDTLSHKGVIETDSVGLLTLGYTDGATPIRAPSYRLWVRLFTNTPVNSGKIDLVITRKETE